MWSSLAVYAVVWIIYSHSAHSASMTLKRVKGRHVSPLSTRRAIKLVSHPVPPSVTACEHRLHDHLSNCAQQVGMALPSADWFLTANKKTLDFVSGPFKTSFKINYDADDGAFDGYAVVLYSDVLIDILHSQVDGADSYTRHSSRLDFIDAIKRDTHWRHEDIENVLVMGGVATERLDVYLDQQLRTGAIFKRNRLVHLYHHDDM